MDTDLDPENSFTLVSIENNVRSDKLALAMIAPSFEKANMEVEKGSKTPPSLGLQQKSLKKGTSDKHLKVGRKKD